MWLQQFKTAVFTKDADALALLIDTMPDFQDTQAMSEVSYLLVEAARILQAKRDETRETLQKIKQNITFLQSAQTDKPSQLNVTL